MNEQTITYVALVASLGGLCFLSLLAITTQPAQKNMYLLEDKEYVLVTGRVAYASVTEKASFLTIIPEDELEVVLFNPYGPRVGQRIQVIGTVSVEQGQARILADKLKVLDEGKPFKGE